MFEVKIVADSITRAGSRLTTITAKYPRIVHCYDNQTEVLCEYRGRRQFMLWEDVYKINLKCEEIKLAAFNRFKEINFEVPREIIASEYTGDMVHMSNQRLSFCVTPNHRMYVGSRKAKYDEWEVIQARDLFGATQKRFRCCGKVIDGDTTVTRKMAELIGFFVGDGHLPKAGKQAMFNLKKQRKIDYLTYLLQALWIDFEIFEYSEGYKRIVFDRFPLLEQCYQPNFEKCIPDTITRSGPDQIEGFLYGLWFSDGSTDKGEMVVFNTTSSSVAGDLGALAAMSGRKITFTDSYGAEPHRGPSGHKGVYKLQSQSEIEPILRKDKDPVNLVEYSGMVYCATVSTGLLLVRRRGIVHVSGNSEVLTHRDRARNSASSRAIPFPKMMASIQDEPFIPIEWGLEQSGMQMGAHIPEKMVPLARQIWLEARDDAVRHAKRLHNIGQEYAKQLDAQYDEGDLNVQIHKSLPNRITEPWMWITVVMTATEWSNFFRLRCHPDAEVHFRTIAEMIRDSLEASNPVTVEDYDWHRPFVSEEDHKLLTLLPNVLTPIDHLNRISVARCARVSYLTHEGKRDLAKDLELFDRLSNGSGFGHYSPYEMVAQAMPDSLHMSGPYRGWHQYRKDFALECG